MTQTPGRPDFEGRARNIVVSVGRTDESLLSIVTRALREMYEAGAREMRERCEQAVKTRFKEAWHEECRSIDPWVESAFWLGQAGMAIRALKLEVGE